MKQTNLHNIFATSCHHFSMAKFCQVRYIIKNKLAQKTIYEGIKT